MPDLVASIAFGWATVLLIAGGVVLLRSRDALQRVLALDVLVAIVTARLLSAPVRPPG
jgi:multicomponent Na+:H+ antiporter subunit F